MSPLVDAPRSKGGFALGDYVEVKDRIRMFYEAHPTGALVTGDVRISVDDDVPRVIVQAFAYRTPDDPHPAIGWSWLELPGKTPYTKGSELENAETSAWGRAIGALGIGIDRSIASKNEVDAKASGPDLGRPELERRAEGLVGTITAGKPPVDLNMRPTPDGDNAFGFKLMAGKKGYQALAIGPLADALAIAHASEDMTGVTATVWGHIEMIPWAKDGKDMPPFARIKVERVQTPGWTLPTSDPETVPMGLVPEDDLSDLDF